MLSYHRCCEWHCSSSYLHYSSYHTHYNNNNIITILIMVMLGPLSQVIYWTQIKTISGAWLMHKEIWRCSICITMCKYEAIPTMCSQYNGQICLFLSSRCWDSIGLISKIIGYSDLNAVKIHNHDRIQAITVWETKFLNLSPENKCPLYILYIFHSPKPIFHSPSSKCARISFPDCITTMHYEGDH